MNERSSPFQPDQIIDYICQNGAFGDGWVDFDSYTISQLEKIKEAMEKKIDRDGDKLTQQQSVINEEPLTYRQVLTKVLVSVNQAIKGKVGKELNDRAGSENKPYNVPSHMVKNMTPEQVRAYIVGLLEDLSMEYASQGEEKRMTTIYMKVGDETQRWKR